MVPNCPVAGDKHHGTITSLILELWIPAEEAGMIPVVQRKLPGLGPESGVKAAPTGGFPGLPRPPPAETSPPARGCGMMVPVTEASSLQSPWGLEEERCAAVLEACTLEGYTPAEPVRRATCSAPSSCLEAGSPWEQWQRDLDGRLAVVASVVVKTPGCGPRCRCETCGHMRRMRVEGPVSWYCAEGCTLCEGRDRAARARMDELIKETGRRVVIGKTDKKKLPAERCSKSSPSTEVIEVEKAQDEGAVAEETKEQVVCGLTKSMKKRHRLKKNK
jgi:hypothetical protein